MFIGQINITEKVNWYDAIKSFIHVWSCCFVIWMKICRNKSSQKLFIGQMNITEKVNWYDPKNHLFVFDPAIWFYEWKFAAITVTKNCSSVISTILKKVDWYDAKKFIYSCPMLRHSFQNFRILLKLVNSHLIVKNFIGHHKNFL